MATAVASKKVAAPKPPKVGKKYAAKRRNGQTVTGKLVDVYKAPGGRGEWAKLAFAPEGAKRGVVEHLTVRPSQLVAA